MKTSNCCGQNQHDTMCDAENKDGHKSLSWLIFCSRRQGGDILYIKDELTSSTVADAVGLQRTRKQSSSQEQRRFLQFTEGRPLTSKGEMKKKVLQLYSFLQPQRLKECICCMVLQLMVLLPLNVMNPRAQVTKTKWDYDLNFLGQQVRILIK